MPRHQPARYFCWWGDAHPATPTTHTTYTPQHTTPPCTTPHLTPDDLAFCTALLGICSQSHPHSLTREHELISTFRGGLEAGVLVSQGGTQPPSPPLVPLSRHPPHGPTPSLGVACTPAMVLELTHLICSSLQLAEATRVLLGYGIN